MFMYTQWGETMLTCGMAFYAQWSNPLNWAS
jgi:hypothetical protein